VTSTRTRRSHEHGAWWGSGRNGHTEHLSEDVDGWTGFAVRFLHLRTRNPATDKPALLAAFLADGTNLGLARMADAWLGLGGSKSKACFVSS
jgi:Tn3 transposase DDE domain-containing protein